MRVRDDGLVEAVRKEGGEYESVTNRTGHMQEPKEGIRENKRSGD